MNRYHVTYYYLATGMEGHADKRDYGVFEANTADEAKGKAADAHCKGDSDARHFFIGCLTAHEMVAEVRQVGTIDMSPTWGEMGTLLCRLVKSGETKALQTMWPEVAKAFAAAEAARVIKPRMPQRLQDEMTGVIAREVRKQQQAEPRWAKGD